MSRIEIPNTDPLLDPEYAASQAQLIFGDQLAVAADLVTYGANLMKRLTSTSVRKVDDLVVVCGLLRQVVSSLDAWRLLASCGATQAAQYHIRAAFESGLYIEWVLTQDKERWARQLYVSSVRRLQLSARRLIPGTTENAAFATAWQTRFAEPYSVPPEVVAQAQQQDHDIDVFLAGTPYGPINADFDRASTGREPDWYAAGPGAVTSLHDMATKVGRQAEYLGIYGPLSKVAHGADPSLHFSVDVQGRFTIEPMRNPSRLGVDFTLVIGMVLNVYRKLLETYRPDELPVYDKTYIEKWRTAFLSPPQPTEHVEEVLLK